MSSAPTVPATSHANVPHEPNTLAAVLSYLLPGLGQIYQGRYGKGLLFMVSLLGMFTLGQAMGQWQNVYLPRAKEGQARLPSIPSSLSQRWHYLGQFWIGVNAWPALWHYFDMPVPAEEANPFVHNFQRMPREAELNRFLINSGKAPDLGWVYTVIAGMLNLLVIYDAYAGPLFLPMARRTPQEPASAMKEGVA